QPVEQTLARAAEFGIPAVAYEKDGGFPRQVSTGHSVLSCSNETSFNRTSGCLRVLDSLPEELLDACWLRSDNARKSLNLPIRTLSGELWKCVTSRNCVGFIRSISPGRAFSFRRLAQLRLRLCRTHPALLCALSALF